MNAPSLRDLVATHFNWAAWERLIRHNGLTIDRPHQTPHPGYPDIIYPIDYGYINGTMGSDGQEVDLFLGSANNGLVATVLTVDHRRRDREFKLVYNCTPEEVYLVHGFLNFAPHLMSGLLVMRYPMQTLWGAAMPE